MIFAAAQIWLTDHLTAKSLCDASKILERSKSFSLINYFSAPAIYNFSTEKRSVYCKLSVTMAEKICKTDKQSLYSEKRQKKKKKEIQKEIKK